MAPFARTTLPAHLNPAKHPGGRPSEYRHEYCQLLIDVTHAEGISLAAFAGIVRVSRDTIYGWIKAHPEFSDAVSRARPIRQLFLERKLLKARKGAETAAAVFALKNAAPDDWRDVKHTEHQHTLAVQTLSDAELYAIAGQKSPVVDAEYEDVTQHNER